MSHTCWTDDTTCPLCSTTTRDEGSAIIARAMTVETSRLYALLDLQHRS